MPVSFRGKTPRRNRILVATFALGTIVATGCVKAPEPVAAPPLPIRSVALIVVDTLPAATLGCYGNSRPTSPVLDQLAAGGVRYERVYATSNWTLPSTATMLTGLYPSEHGAGLTGEIRRLIGGDPPHRLDASIVTVPEILAASGMKTGLFSANPYLQAGLQQGFDEVVIDPMPASDLNDRVIRWLDSVGSAPFFFHIQYMDLHIPVEPPDEFATLFAEEGDDFSDPRLKNWAFGRGTDADGPEFESYRRRRIALHDGAMRYIDTEIGRLLGALEDRDLLDETLVIVTSDHGEEFWQHAAEEVRLGGDPRNIYGIGHGHAMYDEVVRVPLVFSGSGVAGGRALAPVRSLIDLAPTIFEAVGIEPGSPVSGRSLIGEMFEDEIIESDEECLIQSPAYGPDSTALVADGLKLITRVDGVELLFDLRNDPGERRNLVDVDQNRTDTMRAQMTELIGGLADAPEAVRLAADEKTTEQLRALGYVE